VKGAGLLAFAGLMLAWDFVFLSAGSETYLAPAKRWDAMGLAGAMVLTFGAFAALRSILLSDRHKVPSTQTTNVTKLFLLAVVRFHRRRRFWLNAGGALTVLGTLMYVAAIFGSIAERRPWPEFGIR
jgi:hypothetical protein